MSDLQWHILRALLEVLPEALHVLAWLGALLLLAGLLEAAC